MISYHLTGRAEELREFLTPERVAEIERVFAPLGQGPGTYQESLQVPGSGTERMAHQAPDEAEANQTEEHLEMVRNHPGRPDGPIPAPPTNAAARWDMLDEVAGKFFLLMTALETTTDLLEQKQVLSALGDYPGLAEEFRVRARRNRQFLAVADKLLSRAWGIPA